MCISYYLSLLFQDLETGRSKGFGFVVMRDLKGAKKAMAAAPHVIEGRMVQ